MQARLAWLGTVGLAVVLTVASCRSTAPAAAPSARSEMDADRWVERTAASLDLPAKVAQLVMVRAYGQHHHPESPAYRNLVEAISDLGVGGLVVFDSDLGALPGVLDDLQDQAEVPLLVAADLERGLSFRVRRGTVPLPAAMAIGATGSERWAAEAGRITAREARAVGIHWGFGPVADVNVDPANPVIGLRAFGEDPALVARLAVAYDRAASAAGLLGAVKHFPGHGDTDVDSHEALPVLDVDRARLDAVELVPFRATIEAGVDAVMVGHLAVPSIDPSGDPATRSVALGRLLRHDLGFEGLVVTDALEMAGARAAWPGEAAVQALEAGADVLLLPQDPKVTVQAVVHAVEAGRLDPATIDNALRRVLGAKVAIGLHRRRAVDRHAARHDVAHPDDLAVARAIAEASITVLENRNAALPLAAETPLRIVQVSLWGDGRGRSSVATFDDALARRAPTTRFLAGPDIDTESADAIVTAASDATHVVVSAAVPVRASLREHQRALLRRLAGAGPPVVGIAFDSPYLRTELPELDAHVLTYGTVSSSQEAAAAALFGEIEIRGRLPVSIPGHARAGDGLDIDRRAMSLRTPPVPGGAFESVDRLLDDFVARGAFPGGILAVGHRGALVHLRPFGGTSLDADAQPVSAETIYDLASLTKVIAATTMAMILVDEGRLVLDAPVHTYLPRFRGPRKDQITVRQLLTHSSGVDWWAPLYEDERGHDAYVARIVAMPLAHEPGSKTMYSDLGLILLGEILERAAGVPFETFVETRIFAPLGMRDTGYRPDPALRARIAPTEDDPWRGRVLHGEVHDENAFALGGVAPHAGLFSTATDLARFAQMLVNGGVFEHRRLVSRETVAAFTRFSGLEDSTRALGWDTKSPEGSSAGTLFSARSFGHTGFTGTSIWIDPERDLFVILLTNRVHPSRENRMIREVRPAVADAVVRALETP